MIFLEEEDTCQPELVQHPRPNVKRPISNIAVQSENKSLYSASQLAYQTREYNIDGTIDHESDIVMKQSNPGLLAFRNKNTRSQLAKPKTNIKLKLGPLQETSHQSVLDPDNPIKKQFEPQDQSIKELIDEERATLNFTEDPIAYFSKRKDGRGHLFIYLNFAKPKEDIDFSPYDLVKVPFAEVKPEYFTMSANGVTHLFPDGETESISLDAWTKELTIYNVIRKLRIFNQYAFWKPFHIWQRYVKRQRYIQVSNQIIIHPFFTHTRFYETALELLSTSCEDMIRRYLLAFIPQKKFSLNQFHQEIKSNKAALREEFSNFLHNVLDIVLCLDSEIRDPNRVLVKATDYQNLKFATPKLGQLMVIEEKVKAERARRNEEVKKEVKGFCNFIRMVDYMLLETISKSCSDSWKQANTNISQEMSSIFQIEISFTDDGKIAFTPTLDELIDSIRKALHDSIEMLEKLPRFLQESILRPHLRENLSDYHSLFKNGPSFQKIVESDPEYVTIEENIIEFIKHSYQESEIHSQVFIDFFPIYEMGKTWKPDKYVHPRGGESQVFDLTSPGDIDKEEGGVSFDPSTELVVDIAAIEKDVERFKNDDVRLTQFHACTVRGALYIDSKGLRKILNPIPFHSLRALQNMIKELIQSKIDNISKIFRFCSKKLKKEPANLEQYVDYCDFTNKLEKITPLIQNEIKLVDDLYILYKIFGYNPANNVEHSRNPLPDSFRTFVKDQANGKVIRDSNSRKYVQILQERLKAREIKLQQYRDSIETYPKSIASTHLSSLIENNNNIKSKLMKLEPEIHALIRCQEVMDVKLYDLTVFEDVQNRSKFADVLFTLINNYLSIQNKISGEPFQAIDMRQFIEDVENLNQQVEDLEKSQRDQNPLLEEIKSKLSVITPYLDSLNKLSNSKMHFRHWNTLFLNCQQQNAYYAQIKIDELISLGILNEKEKIDEITDTSQGESQLEIDFQRVNSHWLEVRLPLVENQTKTEDQLLLGDLEPIFIEITDTQIQLQTMLLVPFVQGIKDAILNLSYALENYAQVMDAWRTFQANWLILSPFFAQEETKTLLPQQVNKFTVVRRKWISLVRHTVENTTLFHVCSFPSLHDMLVESNQTLELLLAASVKFIDSKRQQMPRFYFLSNDEVLALYSTPDFNIFNQHLVKCFMNVKKFDVLSSEIDNQLAKQSNIQNFSRLKLLKMIGDRDDELSFVKAVPCQGSIEQWVGVLIEQMKASVREAVFEAIHSYSDDGINEWVMKTSSYLATMALEIQFAHDIDECFSNFENNIHTFVEYKDKLKKKIETLCKILYLPDLDQKTRNKTSCVLTLLDSQHHVASKLVGRKQNFSQLEEWNNYIRMKLNGHKIYIKVGDKQYEHGYEFWGHAVQFIHTESSFRAQASICTRICFSAIAFICGSAEVGKKHLLSSIASKFGQFIYCAPCFHEKNNFFIARLLSGVASTGCWIMFHDLNLQTETNIAFLHQTLKDITYAAKHKEKTVSINGVTVPFVPGSEIFFTGYSEAMMSHNISSEMRSTLKPIGFAAPDINLLARIKMISLGYISTDDIAPKLVRVLTTIPYSFSYLPSKSALVIMLTVIEEANELNHIIMKKGRLPFMTYYEDPQRSEEYALTRAIYLRYGHLIRVSHIDIFMRVLYSHFKLFDDFNVFKEAVMNPNCFEDNQIDEILAKASEEFLPSDISAVLKDYIIQKMVTLYHLMNNYPVIIVHGPPKSGKTFIVTLLEKAFKKIYDDPELRQKMPFVLPIQLFELFHISESWTRMFGEMEYNDDGPIWKYGQIHSFMSNLFSFKGEVHRVLRMNGPISPKFANFIAQMAGSADGGLYRLNTLDSYPFEKQLHMLIETESVNHLTPSCIPYCGILPMENFQVDIIYSPVQRLDGLHIIHRALNTYYETNSRKQPNEMIEIIKNLFTPIMLDVVKFMNECPNHLFCVNGNNWIGSDVLITDHLPYLSLLYALYYIDDSKTDKTNEEQIKLVLVMSFFKIYLAIVANSHFHAFSSWIIEHFSLKIPSDWVGFEIDKQFWNSFPRPSLLSLRLNKGNFEPIDHSLINEKPLIMKRLETPGLLLPSDFSVCPPLFLPYLQELGILYMHKQNIILYGPPACGKSSLLKYHFLNQTEIVPIEIPVTSSSTASSLKKFIQIHTSLITKNYKLNTESKTYALIFDNVPSNNIHALEFIRMLASTQTVPIISRKDLKYLVQLKIKSFFIIVTTNSISTLPSRFLSFFFPIKIDSLERHTIKFIMNSIGFQFKVDPRIIEAAHVLVDTFCNKDGFQFNPLKLLDCLCILEGKEGQSPRDYASCAKMLITEMNLLYCHRLDNEIAVKEFQFRFAAIFEEEISNLTETFFSGDEVFYPEISLEKEFRAIRAVISKHKPSLIREELIYYLAAYNESHEEKLIMKFYKPIIRHWALLQRVLSYPGGNALLRSKEGTGRYSLTRFIAYMKDYQFICIPPQSRTNILTRKERRQQIINYVSKPLYKCIMEKKQTIIFIRADDLYDRDFSFLDHLYQSYDFIPFFSKSQLDEMYFKYSSKYVINHDAKLEIYKQICSNLFIKLHFVIATDLTFNSEHFQSFIPLDFSITNKTYFNECAADSLINERLKKIAKYKPEGLPEFFSKIHLAILDFIPNTPINMYYDFLELFNHYIIEGFERLTSHHDMTQSTIGFIDKLKEEIRHLTIEIENNEPLMKEKLEQDEKVKNSFNVKQDTIRARLKKLEEECNNRRNDLENLYDELVPLKTKIVELGVHVDLARARLDSLTNSNLEGLRQIASDPPKIMRIIFSMLTVLLDETGGYGLKFLQDEGFIKSITAKIDHKKIPEQMLEKARQVQEVINFDLKDATTINPSLGIIFEWLMAIFEYADCASDIYYKQAAYDHKEGELKKFQEDSKLEKDSINQVSVSLEKELEAFQKASKTHEDDGQKLDARRERKNQLERVIEKFDILVNKWKHDDLEYEENIHLLFGDTILFSVFLVYFGMMTPVIRKRVMNYITTEMKTTNIKGNCEDPFNTVFKQLALMDEDANDYYQRTDKQMTKETEMCCRHVQSSMRTPLLIDPDEIVIRFLTKSIKPSRLIKTSMVYNHFEDVVIRCMMEGKILLIYDVNWLHPLLYQMLPVDLVPSDTKMDVKIGEKTIPRHRKFKMYLISSLNGYEEIPSDLAARINLINISTSSLGSVEEAIKFSFLNFFLPELSVKTGSRDRAIIHQEMECNKYEKDILEVTADIIMTCNEDKSYDFLDDEEAYMNIIQAKECYLAANRSKENSTRELPFEKELSPFMKIIHKCVALWKTLSRSMPRVDSCHTFEIREFIDIINSGINASEVTSVKPTEIELKQLENKIISNVMEFVMPKFSFRDAIAFFFISGVYYKEMEQLVQPENFERILNHIYELTINSCDFTLLEIQNGDPLDQLKFSSTVNVFNLVLRFVAESFGSRYQDHLNHFKLEQLISNSSTVPVLVKIHSQKDPSALIDFYAAQLGVPYKAISLAPDVRWLNQSIEALKKYMEVGMWVSLHYMNGDPLVAGFLNEMIMMLTKPHKDFRLILVCRSTDFISTIVLNRCIRIEYEAFPSIKHQMLEIYSHFANSLNMTNKNVEAKKIMYIEALFFSIMRYRSFFEPSGLSCDYPLSQMCLRNLIARSKDLIDRQPPNQDLPFGNISNMISEISIGGMMVDQWDRIKLKAHLKGILKDQLVLDDSTEKELWKIPPDMHINNYPNHIEKLPIFATGDILMMNKYIAGPMMHWNLSRWISKPFIRLRNRPQYTSNDVLMKLESLKALFPSEFNIADKSIFNTPLMIALLCEIENLNNAISIIRRDISDTMQFKNKEVFEAAAIDSVPMRWKELVGFAGCSTMSRFFTLLRDKSDFFQRFIIHGMISQSINIRFIRNVRGLFMAFLNEIAIQRHQTVDTLEFDFIIGDDKNERATGPCLILTNVWLIGGNWDQNNKKFVMPNIKTQQVSRMPPIVCVPHNEEEEHEEGTFLCPFFCSSPSRSFTLQCQKVRIDGIQENFITSVHLPTDLTPEEMATNGVALVCHVQDIFID